MSGELLKGLLASRALASRPKVYTAETGIQSLASLNATATDLFINLVEDTIFLSQTFGVNFLTQNVTTGASQVLRDTMPNVYSIQFQVYDVKTLRRFYSSGTATQAANTPPSLNERRDYPGYSVWDGSDTIQVNVKLGFIPAGAPPNGDIAVAFYGTEYLFNSDVDLTALKQEALSYEPPAKDQARALALDPMTGVVSSSTPSQQHPSVLQSAIRSIQNEIANVNKYPQDGNTQQYLRFLHHRLNQTKAALQASTPITNVS